ncbi:MAG: IS66 family insertion sequence element accessory protein TnpB [Gammaproteobacteria bacterium]|nr:IS66 family insertion sequence element accessory protein TnpB [Gammaproteobacteria bacterium]
MLSPGTSARVYLAVGATDMRKSIDGLAATVVAELALDPLSAHWFVFCNRGRDKLKILYWDHNGFWLYYRRLERGRFSWPAQAPSAALSITARQLAWLLDGLALDQSRAPRGGCTYRDLNAKSSAMPTAIARDFLCCARPRACLHCSAWLLLPRTPRRGATH